MRAIGNRTSSFLAWLCMLFFCKVRSTWAAGQQHSVALEEDTCLQPAHGSPQRFWIEEFAFTGGETALLRAEIKVRRHRKACAHHAPSCLSCVGLKLLEQRLGGHCPEFNTAGSMGWPACSAAFGQATRPTARHTSWPLLCSRLGFRQQCCQAMCVGHALLCGAMLPCLPGTFTGPAGG